MIASNITKPEKRFKVCLDYARQIATSVSIREGWQELAGGRVHEDHRSTSFNAPSRTRQGCQKLAGGRVGEDHRFNGAFKNLFAPRQGCHTALLSLHQRNLDLAPLAGCEADSEVRKPVVFEDSTTGQLMAP